MKRGYSKLLINDLILPDKGAHPYLAMMDITMMCLLNARERTQRQWRELLESEGFRVVRFHVHADPTVGGIVEAELV